MFKRVIGVSIAHPKANTETFTAKAKPYEVIEQDKVIADALKTFKMTEKEKELLQQELDKPTSARNQALINKYRNRITEVLDGWPDLKLGKYSITALAPDDPEVKIEQRPMPWFANFDLKVYGNEYLFKFPIQLHSQVGGRNVYRIDKTQTYLDGDGDLIESMTTDVSPYVILKNYIDGDTKHAEDYLYYKDNGDPYFNFNFPGFMVSYKKLNPAKTNPQPKPKSNPASQFKDDFDPTLAKRDVLDVDDIKYQYGTGLQFFELDPDGKVVNNLDRARGKTIESITAEYQLKGLDTGVKTVPREKCIVNQLYIGDHAVGSAWLILDSIDEKTGGVFASLTTGVKQYKQWADANTVLYNKSITTTAVTASVHAMNQNTLKQLDEFRNSVK